jgi:acylphosphatase
VNGVRFRLTGRVQGVGLRVWVRSVALERGIVGSVRNCADGTVEVEATGPAPALAAFRDDLRRGPPYARIDEVTESPAEITQEVGFSVRG